MKHRFYAVILLSAVFFVLLSLTSVLPDSNNANVVIPAKQEFVLGEYESSNYRAKLRNESNKLIEVEIVDKETNVPVSTLNLSGNETTVLSVSKVEQVLLKNRNDEAVTVKVKLNKNVEGMSYQVLSEVE